MTRAFSPLRDLGGPQDVKDWEKQRYLLVGVEVQVWQAVAVRVCDPGFDKALLMGCGKAFYHWSVLACIKGMNLNKHEAAHARRRAKAGKTHMRTQPMAAALLLHH